MDSWILRFSAYVSGFNGSVGDLGGSLGAPLQGCRSVRKHSNPKATIGSGVVKMF